MKPQKRHQQLTNQNLLKRQKKSLQRQRKSRKKPLKIHRVRRLLKLHRNLSPTKSLQLNQSPSLQHQMFQTELRPLKRKFSNCQMKFTVYANHWLVQQI